MLMFKFLILDTFVVMVKYLRAADVCNVIRSRNVDLLFKSSFIYGKGCFNCKDQKYQKQQRAPF